MRVVAVSAETSLAAALNMMDGWEVVFAREGDDVGNVVAGAAVLLAGGGTQHGLDVISDLRARGVNTPAVVLGDADPPEGTESTVLRPPFTLDELRAAVEGAVRAGQRPAPSPTEPAVNAVSSLASAGDEPMPRSVDQEPSWLEEIDAPAPAPPAVEGNGSLAIGERSEEPSVLPDEPSAQPDDRTTAPARPEEQLGGATPAAMSEPTRSSEELAIDKTPTPPREAPSEPTIVEVATPATTPVPAKPDAGSGADRGKRRKGRRRDRDEKATAASAPPVATTSTGSVDARLRLAEQAARAIEEVLRDLPFLADLEALSQAVVGEVVEAFSPEIVALYLPSGDSFWVAGGHQLTPAERRLSVKPEHPLFRELLAKGEPMLIAPLDLARAMVSGIAGARTEAMIAGPIKGSSGYVGVIVVGRGDFADKDLDTLADLAAEAASGLAVAQAIDRLRSRRV